MMRVWLAFFVVPVLAIAFPAFAGPMRIVGGCFTVHGRLNFGNGTPGVRIWKIGTGSSVGVFDCQGNPESDNLVPGNVKKAIGKEYSRAVFADFDVCPLSFEKPGERQRVCIRSARHIVLGSKVP